MKKMMALLMAVVMLFGVLSVNVGAQTFSETTAQTSEPTIETTTDTQEPTLNPIVPGDGIGNDIISPMSIGRLYTYVDIESGYYYLKNFSTQMYMDIHGPNTDIIHQWTYHNGKQEIWYIQKVENTSYYTIQSQYSGKYLGIANTNVGEANINQYSAISDSTYWRIKKANNVERYVFEPKTATDTFLNAPDSTIGSELQLVSYSTGGYNANWMILKIDAPTSGNYFVQNIQTSRVASPYGPYTDEGTKIHQWDFSAYNHFRWFVEFHTEDFSCTIKNVYTNKYLGYSSEADTSGNYYIEQYASNTSENTRWRIYISYSGNLIFTPRDYELKTYALSVDPVTDNVGSYLNLVSYTDNSEYKDEWKLVIDYPYAGTIADVWYSDADTVGYWTASTISICKQNLSSSSSFKFDEGIDNAINQWGNALGISFTFTNDPLAADVVIYGGTTSQMETQSRETNTTWTGLTQWYDSISSYTLVNIEGTNDLKYVKRRVSANIYIKCEGSETEILQTIIHEFGHVLGYDGHPTAQNNVMNSVNGVTTLTTAEKRYLQEIYSKFVG